ncbi:MAG: hypothetical protein ABIQ95_11305 [Bdellovibrionia bacterium]
MELNYDWRNFQSFFFVRKDKPQLEISGTINLIIDQKTVVSAFSDGEELSEWFGSPYDDVLKAFPHREVIIYDQKKVDNWMVDATHLPHAYDQIQFLRTHAKPQFITGNRVKKDLSPSSNHFLLKAIQSWWQKLLPSSYGIFIRLDGVHGRSILIVIKRGRLDSFQVPDLSGMIPERRKHPTDVSRHLSENYLVPVQGLFLTTEEWLQWSISSNPWPKILKSLRSGKNKLNPYSWGVLFLIACRSYFGI